MSVVWNQLKARHQSMQLKNILPEEILLKIFSEIDSKEMRKLLEISLEWRGLLLRNAEVMRKLPLILMNDTWREKMDFVKKYGKYIREIVFRDTELESYDEVMKVLEMTPKVEKLTLKNLKVLKKESEEVPEENPETKVEEKLQSSLTLKNLKNLIIDNGSNIDSLDFITTRLNIDLSRLDIHISSEDQLPALQQLLITSENLKSFELSSEIDEIFAPSSDLISEFKFQLDQLIVNSPLMKFNHQFANFLSSQKFLKKISLNSPHVDFRFHNIIFSEYENLRSLQINIDTFGTSDSLKKLKAIPAMKSVQNIHILGRNLHINVFEALLKIFPKLQTLHIENLTQFYSDKIQTLSLTHLSVDYLSADCLRVQKMRKNIKLRLGEITHGQPKEKYAKNLQNFCDLPQFNDKTKDIIETF